MQLVYHMVYFSLSIFIVEMKANLIAWWSMAFAVYCVVIPTHVSVTGLIPNCYLLLSLFLSSSVCKCCGFFIYLIFQFSGRSLFSTMPGIGNFNFPTIFSPIQRI